MCGIVGIVAANGHAADLDALQRMNDLLQHRGPDGQGFMVAADGRDQRRHAFVRRAECAPFEGPIRVGLGHRRLAILDLSDRGLQPMRGDSDRIWVVFNGEIYNHREVRSLLRSRGHAFKTRTDTEVLLAAYVEWGQQCLDHLDGMFAFAIWDDVAGRLFCARDRLGIKPFYFAAPSGYFVFASEIKAFTALPRCQLTPDDEAVVGFLVHANCDYGQRTAFREIRALPAGHSLSIDAATCSLSIRQYWAPGVHTDRPMPDDDRVAQLRDSLTETIRTHLISDVRAGSCLSGGLDSSTVVGLMGHIQRSEPRAAAAMGDRLDTFTSCYENSAFDEREYALAVSNSVGSNPHLVFPSHEDFWNDFRQMAWHQDMPFGALSYYAQWRVMRAARETGVKVLLDGQGGDEVFGGYAKFRYAYIASLGRARRFGAAAKEFIAMLSHGDRYVLDIRNGYRYLPARIRAALNVDSVLKRVLIPDWHNAASDESTPATRWWRNAFRSRRASEPTLMQQIQMDDIVVDTLPQLLRMEDRSSMAFSLEARVPLLDHKLVQLGLGLPDHLKVNRGWSKFAIRQATAGLLPESVRLRKTKLGFAAPDRDWLAHRLRSQVTELLAGDLRCRRYIDVTSLGRWYGSHESRRANTESYLGLFRILSLEMWMRAFSLS